MINRNFFKLGILLVVLVLAGTLGCASTERYSTSSTPPEYNNQTHGYYEQHGYNENQRYYYPNGPLGPDSFGYNYKYYQGENNSFQYRTNQVPSGR